MDSGDDRAAGVAHLERELAAVRQRELTQIGVARILSNASSIGEVAPALLEFIAVQLDWRVGLLWIQRDGVQRCSATWEQFPSGESGFAASCRRMTCTPGAGLAGPIFTAKTPGWVADLRRDSGSSRLSLAAEYGLRSACGFPITVSESVLGVMEFFTDEPRPPDEGLLEMAGSLGRQIGQFIEGARAQHRLAEREESYRVLTETASDGIITIDANHTIMFVNTQAAKIFGYTREELTGADVAILMPERLRKDYKSSAARHIETEDRRFSWQSVPVTGQHRHGHEIPLEVSLGEYRQGSRHVFVGVIRDVTERKRLDERMRQTAKLESLGVLAGGIAHDFNNLLTGILGNISLALEMLSDADPSKTILAEAMSASERAAHLTKQMLAYSGKGRFLIEPIDVSNLVRDISTLVKSSIPKHVSLRLDLEKRLPPVEADVAQLQQLIMNLVINGAEAIPADRRGTLLVTTRSREIDADAIEQTFSADEIVPGRYVAIGVHDNGVGIEPETLSKIFDPFFTTKFTGRGLGLAAALGIVRGHKGTLKVFTTPGQGTTFRVFLPATTAALRVAAQPAGIDLAGSGTVLVVDDEAMVRSAATASLEHYGYTVLTADHGRQGVERFRVFHSQLAIVILDMTMPVMSGEQALEAMQSIDPGVPVVLSSGYNEAEATGRFAGKRLAGFIQKPYTAAGLAEKIQRVLQESKV